MKPLALFIRKFFNKIFRIISGKAILISKLRYSKMPRTLEPQYSRLFW